MNSDERLDQLTTWVRQFDGFANAVPTPASGDASFRRYFRVHGDATCIVMDAPPPQEDCHSFVEIAGFLEQMGLNSPRILEADVDRGFLLLTDLGSVQYLDEIATCTGSTDKLYAAALDALLKIQANGVQYQGKLPPYDEKLLRFELSLFHDWLCETHLGIQLSGAEETGWADCCNALVRNALEQQKVFVHRDYHSRNLMVAGKNGPGILDFQDAVEGPLTYDLVSLLKDCYVKRPAGEINRHVMYFFDRLPNEHKNGLRADQFTRAFDLMGAQRHLKAAGIFARLLHRDGKSGYLQDVPRTLSYIIDIAPQYDELAFLESLIAERVLPALEESGR